MSRIANELSWSFSRHHCFQSCLKRYYYTYYASWGGWKPEAPAAVRELYILKRLSTRAQWAGHHAHSALEFLLKQARTDSSGSVAARAEPKEIEQMRREFAGSRTGAYRKDPIHTAGLFEHEYQLQVPAEEWKAMADRVSLSIQHFLSSALWAELQALPEEAFLAVEQRSHFHLDGLKVFAIPDLVIRREGQVRIYDWKTGKAPLSEHRAQLGVYALLATDRWTADPAEIEAVAYNPITDEYASFTYSAEELETLRDFIRDSADEMLFPLEDPATNRAGDGETFDCTDQEEVCKRCVFLRVCPRWKT